MPPRFWSEEEIGILCDGAAEGEAFSKISRKLPGRTTNACIGKFHRIASEIERDLAEQRWRNSMAETEKEKGVS